MQVALFSRCFGCSYRYVVVVGQWHETGRYYRHRWWVVVVVVAVVAEVVFEAVVALLEVVMVVVVFGGHVACVCASVFAVAAAVCFSLLFFYLRELSATAAPALCRMCSETIRHKLQSPRAHQVHAESPFFVFEFVQFFSSTQALHVGSNLNTLA